MLHIRFLHGKAQEVVTMKNVIFSQEDHSTEHLPRDILKSSREGEKPVQTVS